MSLVFRNCFTQICLSAIQVWRGICARRSVSRLSLMKESPFFRVYNAGETAEMLLLQCDLFTISSNKTQMYYHLFDTQQLLFFPTKERRKKKHSGGFCEKKKKRKKDHIPAKHKNRTNLCLSFSMQPSKRAADTMRAGRREDRTGSSCYAANCIVISYGALLWHFPATYMGNS